METIGTWYPQAYEIRWTDGSRTVLPTGMLTLTWQKLVSAQGQPVRMIELDFILTAHGKAFTVPVSNVMDRLRHRVGRGVIRRRGPCKDSDGWFVEGIVEKQGGAPRIERLVKSGKDPTISAALASEAV
jgi:hypothetical protein